MRTAATEGSGMPDPGTSAEGVEVPYDATVQGALAPAAGAAALLFAGLSATHPLLLEGAARSVLTPAAGATAVLLGAAALLLRRHQVPAHLAHPAAAGLVTLPVAHGVGQMVLTSDPRQSTLVMLAVAAAGTLLLAPRWLLAVLYLAWGAWLVGAFAVGPSGQWPHVVTGLVVATALCVLVNGARRVSARHLADAKAAAEAAAVRDPLTGVANRRGLAMVGAQLLEQARRQGDAVHSIFVDVDGLKVVNETLGPPAGDEVLVAVADALRQVTRATDVVARWGGDEFCVVGPGPGMPPLELERRVRERVLRHPPVPPEVWPGTVSAGGSMLAPWDSGSLETLLGKADQEMYLRRSLRAERAGRLARPAASE